MSGFCQVRRSLGRSVAAAVMTVFGIFLLTMMATAFFLVDQGIRFGQVFQRDYSQTLAAADLVREAETLNGQILERVLGISRAESEQSLQDIPQIAIFRDQVQDVVPGKIDHLVASYLDAIRTLDDAMAAERVLLDRREALIDESARISLLMGNHPAMPDRVREKALVVLSQSAALLAAMGPGQSRRLSDQLDQSRVALRLDAHQVSTNFDGTEMLVTIDTLAARVQDLYAQVQTARRRTLAGLRLTRTAAQKINGATYGDLLDRRDAAQASTETYAVRSSLTLALMAVVVVISVGLTIWLMMFITRRVIARMNVLNSTMLEHVQGLRPAIPVEGEDEIAQMGKAFQIFVEARDRAEADLAQVALTDSLSGLGNRRGFDQRLDMEWRRCARDGLPLTVILADIDHFKRYNDILGHPQGDQCIRDVAAAFSKVVGRPGDYVARYGGEEFVFILPATDGDGGRLVAEAVRSEIRALALSHPGAPESGGIVTLSLGVGGLIPKDSMRPQYLIDQVDAALYVAKKQGRDRVSVWEGE